MSFASLGLHESILRAVTERGYEIPTPIQAQAIPAVLSGRDLLAGAQTGTGKTAGFTLPILQRLITQPIQGAAKKHVRVLVLVPTRELAAQVEQSVKDYGKYVDVTSTTIFGGVGIQPQINKLRQGVDIVVATPGRLLDHIGQRTVDLSKVEIFVLDEADRMLDMGFIRDIKKVMALLPAQVAGVKRQNLLFSATFADEIKTLADNLLDKPEMIEVARRNQTAEAVEQKVIMVDKGAKRAVLSHLIKDGNWFQVLVFTRTKHGANRLAEQLGKDGINAMAIHGNKSQNARTKALAEFKSGELQALVATDIAARGLDIVELPHVVNYELPNVPEDYVHRIGRTGRAGATGEAWSLVSNDEKADLAAIERVIKRTLPRVTVEGFDAAAQQKIAAVEPPDVRGPKPPGRGRSPQGGGRAPQGTSAPRNASAPRAPAQARGEPRGDSRNAPRGDSPARGDGARRSPNAPASAVRTNITGPRAEGGGNAGNGNNAGNRGPRSGNRPQGARPDGRPNGRNDNRRPAPAAGATGDAARPAEPSKQQPVAERPGFVSAMARALGVLRRT
ncbi:DEAD/DEAH box helicase [soil metagenome]